MIVQGFILYLYIYIYIEIETHFINFQNAKKSSSNARYVSDMAKHWVSMIIISYSSYTSHIAFSRIILVMVTPE